MDIAENQALHAVLYAVIGDTGALSIYMLGGSTSKQGRYGAACFHARPAGGYIPAGPRKIPINSPTSFFLRSCALS